MMQLVGGWRGRQRVMFAGVATIGFVLAFSLLEIDRSEYLDAARNLKRLVLCYFVGFAVAWVALSVLAWRLWRGGADGGKRWAAGAAILLVALLARLIVLQTTSPQLSDDIWRYVHDGSQLYDGGNPYKYPPSVLDFGAPALYRLKATPHAELVTIYQPVSQWVFVVGYKIYFESSRFNGLWDPVGDRSMRLLFILFDMLVIGVLLRRLKLDGRSPWWAALYAWHPLAITEIAGSGHQDVIGIALLMCAMMFADPKRATQGRGLIAGACFAGALAVKPVVAPLALLFAWSLRRRPGAMLSGFAGTILALTAAYLPFLLWDPGFGGMIETIQRFVGAWEFNGSLHAMLTHSWWAGFEPLLTKLRADALLLAVVGLIVLVCLWRDFDLWRSTMIFFFAALLLTSTAHPWYLLWVLAMLPVHFNRAAWVWSLTISWSYVVLRDVGQWDLPVWVGFAEYVPVYVMLFLALRNRPAGEPESAVASG